MLEFKVTGQRLARVDSFEPATDSEGYLQAAFSFSADWDGTAKTALFWSGASATKYRKLLDSSGRCTVPAEVLLDNSGRRNDFRVMVYGVSDAFPRVTTNELRVELSRSGYGDAVTPAAPTPDVYEQILAAYADAQAASVAAGEEAEFHTEELQRITGYPYKNLLPNPLETSTSDGITFTVNDDKSVTVDGTATYNAYKKLLVTLPAGDYVLTGCPVGGSTNGYHQLLAYGDRVGYDIESNNAAFTLPTEMEVQVHIRVMNGTTVDNLTFYPMIRPAAITDPAYLEYGRLYVPASFSELTGAATMAPWYGKKANVIGDSIVQGSYGDFVTVMRDALKLATARNYGIGGSLITSSDRDSEIPPVVLRFADMDDDADIIVVHAGTNDYSHQIPLGETDSTDVATFNGALNVLMDGLRDKYPDKLIVFDSILHRYNDKALAVPCSAYRQAIEDRCEAHHIVFYDAYKYTGFDFVKGYYDHVLTNDGLHPNEAGARILGRKLAGFLSWQ